MRIKLYHAQYRLALSESQAWELVQQVIDRRSFEKDRCVTLIRRGGRFVLKHDPMVKGAKVPEVIGSIRRQGDHLLVDVRVPDQRWSKVGNAALLVLLIGSLYWGVVSGDWEMFGLMLCNGLIAYGQTVKSRAEKTRVAAIERCWMMAMHTALSAHVQPSIDVGPRRALTGHSVAA